MMEVKRFPLPEVSAELSKMIEARLHNDDRDVGARVKELQRRLTGSVATPIYLVLDPEDEHQLGRQDGPSSASTFARFLRDSARRAEEPARR